jgi:hypothetical protein
MSLEYDPFTMKVCVAGGEPLACDVDLRGRERYYDWHVSYVASEPPPQGTVEVEVRIVPGIVLAGKGVIHGYDYRYGEGFLVDIRGAGPIRAKDTS